MTTAEASDFLGSLPPMAVVLGAGAVLAGLDLVGAYFAEEWSTTRHPFLWALGAGAFVVLFAVYAGSLRYAELTAVTLAWIVLLQTGVMLLDHFHYGNTIPLPKWLAVAAVMVLMGYILMAPDASSVPPEHIQHEQTVELEAGR